jgi:NAD+ kinase
MKVAFTIRRNCERCAKVVSRIVDLIPGDWQIIYDKECAKFLNVRGTDLEAIVADIIIAVGGDGTALRATQMAKGPILGINMGGLGFLTEVEIGDVEKSIYKLIKGEYKIEKNMKLKVKINGLEVLNCTNEAVIHTSKIAKIRKFKIYAGDTFLDSGSADGIIVSTPIGSTSYNYSAGGPIIHPSLNVMVITYLAPFRSRVRPMVIPADQPIKIRLSGPGQDSLVIVDGQAEYPVNEKDEIEISASESKAEFITFRDSFYDKIREKLIKHVVN